jgi:hypothetical protein
MRQLSLSHSLWPSSWTTSTPNLNGVIEVSTESGQPQTSSTSPQEGHYELSWLCDIPVLRWTAGSGPVSSLCERGVADKRPEALHACSGGSSLALTKEFSRLLDEAIERRTEYLRRLVVPGNQGAPKKYTKRIRDKLKRKLLLAASEVLVRRRARREFRQATIKRRLRHLGGFGIQCRFDRIFHWAKKTIHGPIVYAFWRGKKCLYVGKGGSCRRLRTYRKSIYLKEADSLEVWRVVSKSQLPRAECLAIHLFHPRDNKQRKAAKVKWGKSCPVCRRHDEIASEIGALLRLRA